MRRTDSFRPAYADRCKAFIDIVKRRNEGGFFTRRTYLGPGCQGLGLEESATGQFQSLLPPEPGKAAVRHPKPRRRMAVAV